jgi:hypothetical protein
MKKTEKFDSIELQERQGVLNLKGLITTVQQSDDKTDTGLADASGLKLCSM